MASSSSQKVDGATIDEGFVVAMPVGHLELLLSYVTIYVIGRMRALLLQISKSLIYSTNPRCTNHNKCTIFPTWHTYFA